MRPKLRSWLAADAATLQALADDFDVTRWMSDFPHPYRKDDAETFLAEAAETPNRFFAVEVDGDLVGGAGLEPRDDTHNGVAVLGYWFSKRYWGRGIASAVVGLLMERAFASGFRRVEARVFERNTASVRVLQKAGFTLEGRLRASYVERDGTPCDELIFGYLRDDLSEIRLRGVCESALRLERPSTARAASFAVLRDACLAQGEDAWAERGALAHTNPVAYAAMLREWAEGRNVPEGWVPADTFWIVEGQDVVGECDVRHWLTPKLRNVGGHIGYVVHPAHRGRGIATFALRECLEVLAARGDSEALLTCAPSNAASIRVIEKCGGRRIEDSSGGRLRYLIPLGRSGEEHQDEARPGQANSRPSTDKMLDHLSLGASDIERSMAFYDAVLAPLGYVRLWSDSDAAGYGCRGQSDEPFAIKWESSKVVASSQRFHVAFASPTPEAVLEFHATALANGAVDDGAPGLHLEYGENYFAAFVFDPDGHRLEAVCHK